MVEFVLRFLCLFGGIAAGIGLVNIGYGLATGNENLTGNGTATLAVGACIVSVTFIVILLRAQDRWR